MMCGADADPAFVTAGFSGIEDEYRWTDGKVAIFPLKVEDDSGGVMFSMTSKVFNGHQNGKLFADDHLVYADVLETGTLEELLIPDECMADGN